MAGAWALSWSGATLGGSRGTPPPTTMVALTNPASLTGGLAAAMLLVNHVVFPNCPPSVAPVDALVFDSANISDVLFSRVLRTSRTSVQYAYIT